MHRFKMKMATRVSSVPHVRTLLDVTWFQIHVAIALQMDMTLPLVRATPMRMGA